MAINLTWSTLWVLALTVVAGVPGSRAHDLWLEPSTYFFTRGQEVTARLRLGENGQPLEMKPIRRAEVVRLNLLSGHRPTQDLLARLPREGETAVATFKPEGGNLLLTMERVPKRLDLDGGKFTHYLAEEGMTDALARRAQAGQNDQPGHERYRRYLKTLVQDNETTARPAVLYRRRIGQRLEILLENNPGRLRSGQPVRVRVLFEGRPLPNARVTALHRPQPDGPADRKLEATTGPTGRAVLPPFDVNGPWMIRMVHLRPVMPTGPGTPDGEDVNWESFWAAYTFGVHLLPAAVNVPNAPSRD